MFKHKFSLIFFFEKNRLSFGLSLLDNEKYDISKISGPGVSNTLDTLPESEWTFVELTKLFPNCVVTMNSGNVDIRLKPKPSKPLKTKKSRITKCAKCDIVVRLHDRRGVRGRFCRSCWLEQMINCKFCHKLTTREHRCVSLPYEKTIGSKKYRLCTQCPASGEYFAINGFKRHVQRKHQQYLFQCSKCPNRFSCNSDLNNHMKNHSVQMTYKCNHCDSMFRWQTQLSEHMKTHPVDRKKFITVDHSLPKPNEFAVGLNAVLSMM